MKAFKINDIKNFMNKLLVDKTFDSFLTNEITITTFCNYHIDCHMNKNYYSKEELELMNEADYPMDYISWSKIKPICFELIKGKKIPDKFKITLSLPSAYYNSVLSDTSENSATDIIDNLFIHITFENNSLSIITASSLKVFTMDKSIDTNWDNYIQKHLLSQFQFDEL